MVESIIIRKPNGEKIELPLWRECGECGGRGEVGGITSSAPGGETFRCHKCNGLGKIPIYYTPEKFEELTGEKVADDTAVWVYNSEISEWKNMVFEFAIMICNRLPNYFDTRFLINFPNQPAPKPDYRPDGE